MLALLLVLGCGLFHVAQAAEILTLFTTPAERQIINSNRYKSDEVKTRPVAVVEDVVEAPIQQLIMEEIHLLYRISGITSVRDGPHTGWFNQVADEYGENRDDDGEVVGRQLFRIFKFDPSTIDLSKLKAASRASPGLRRAAV